MITFIKNLPEEIAILVWEFLPTSVTMWLNKSMYVKNHYLVRTLVSKNLYESYIRCMVRKDFAFAFKFIVKENIMRWNCCKNIIYKNISYPNFYCFIKEYCIINESTNCRNVLEQIFNESGLSKNRHKKNNILNIRWRT